MTPAQQAVIDAAKKWAKQYPSRYECGLQTFEFTEASKHLSEAVRRLEEEERKQTT